MRIDRRTATGAALAIALFLACNPVNAPGTWTVDASRAIDEVRSAGVAASAQGHGGMARTDCRGVVGAETVEKVVVPSGAHCVLQGTRVTGDVEVRADAAVLIEAGARVGGSVRSAGANRVLVAGSNIDGGVQADGTSYVLVADGSAVRGGILLRSGGVVRVADATVTGDIEFQHNRGLVEGVHTRTSGNFHVVGNRGGVVLLGNRIGANLECTENAPAPGGSGNAAASKEDQCSRL